MTIAIEGKAFPAEGLFVDEIIAWDPGNDVGQQCVVLPQAAQSRNVNNYKDLYGNLDNRLKKIFTSKSSQ